MCTLNGGFCCGTTGCAIVKQVTYAASLMCNRGVTKPSKGKISAGPLDETVWDEGELHLLRVDSGANPKEALLLIPLSTNT